MIASAAHLVAGALLGLLVLAILIVEQEQHARPRLPLFRWRAVWSVTVALFLLADVTAHSVNLDVHPWFESLEVWVIAGLAAFGIAVFGMTAARLRRDAGGDGG